MRLLFALAGALLLTACGGPAEREDWPAPSPALWEVTGPDGERGWLFGTIHALPASVEWRSPTLDGALEEAGVLVVEIADLGNSNQAAGVFNRLSQTEGLPPLSERVEPEDRPALERLLDRADIDEDAFAGIDTWGAALVLASRARELDVPQSVDRALIGAADRVVGLETFEVQYGIFDSLPEADQADLLMVTAGDTSDEEQRIEAWLTGDLSALERSGEALLGDPELREALQTNRNLRWAPRIAAMIRRGERPFVAVGTAHMFGPQSLPALLEEAGFTIARVQ